MKILQICVLLALGLSALLSCNSNPDNSPTSAPDVSEKVLSATPEVVSVERVNYAAEVFPYRDFMPDIGRSTSERGLIAIARICRNDSLAIPQSLHLKYIWVFHGRECWATQLGEERQDFQGNFCREAVARGGPKWEPGTKVDVVIGFTIGDSGMFIVRSATATIEHTE